MKRKVSIILACLLVAIMALSLCACGEGGKGGEKETTAAVETKAPVEKETTAPVETVAPQSGSVLTPITSIPGNPVVSDDNHIVIDQDGVILSYETSGNDIVRCVCWIDMESETIAKMVADEINKGEDDTDYGYTVLGAGVWNTYVGIEFGAEAWEGMDAETLQLAADAGVLTQIK